MTAISKHEQEADMGAMMVRSESSVLAGSQSVAGIPMTWERMVAKLNEDIEEDPKSIEIVVEDEIFQGSLVGVILRGSKFIMMSPDLDIEPVFVWRKDVSSPVMFANGCFFFKVGTIGYTIAP